MDDPCDEWIIPVKTVPMPANEPWHYTVRKWISSGSVAMVIALFMAYPGLAGFSDPELARWVLVAAWCAATIALVVSEFVWNNPAQKLRHLLFCAVFSGTLGGIFYFLDYQSVQYRENAMMPLVFKPSPYFTNSNRTTIRHALLSFRNYLKKIGFPVQAQMPHIAVSLPSPVTFNGRPVIVPYVSFGGPITYNSVLSISATEAYSAKEYVRSYSAYESGTALIGTVHDSLARDLLANSIGSYLFSSFKGERRVPSFYDPWDQFFWDVRSSTSQEFADSLVVYTLRSFQDAKDTPTREMTAANNEIYDMIMSALIVVDDGSHREKVIELVNTHKIGKQLPTKRSFRRAP